MAFGNTSLSATAVGVNQIPVSSVAVPNEPGGNLTALEGGPESTDSNGNKTAPAAVILKTGASVALSSPPANTNAGSDTTLTFASKVGHWLIQNNSSASCYVELDATASTGSTALAPGSTWRDDIPVTSPHVYTAAATPLNAINGIIVKGWA